MPIKVLLTKDLAREAIANRRDNQGAVQQVWLQACKEVELDPVRYAGEKVPEFHWWRNIDRNGEYVVQINVHRGAYAREIQTAETNPLRALVVETLRDITRFE